MLHSFGDIPSGRFQSQPRHCEFSLRNGVKNCAAQNLKIAAQFSTKLAQFFDTISKQKFAMGGWLSKRPWRISPEGVQHKILKMQHNLAQN